MNTAIDTLYELAITQQEYTRAMIDLCNDWIEKNNELLKELE